MAPKRQKKKAPPKTTNDVTQTRVLQSIRAGYNPIRNLTPAVLSSQLESFDAGYLRMAALTWQKIEERDDILKSVVPKRKKAVSRHGYEIIIEGEDTPEAQKQKEALEYFYSNLQSTSAVDLNYRGGVPLLIRQMMDSVGKRYAVHEIVWRPGPAGLTAQFRFVPLWFFENTTGELRYLESDGSIAGIPLEPAEWMVTAGDGVMTACSVSYMFKHMPLKDWVIYSERHGMPGIHATTDATEGSTEWNVLVEALQQFGIDWSMVTNKGVEVDKVDMSTKGELPFPKLVERMDRALSAIWRGADLSTMSSGTGDGTGASLQGEEAEILETDDAGLISETLNEQVDRHVIRFVLGTDNLLAKIKLNIATKQDVETDIKVDQFLIDNGVDTAVSDIRKRYGRPVPDDGEELISVPRRGGSASASSLATPEPIQAANVRQFANARTAVEADKINEQLAANTRQETAEAFASDLQPLRERLEYVIGLEDADFARAALLNLQADLPGMLIDMNAEPDAAKTLEDSLSAALLNGVTESAALREEPMAA